MSAMSSEAFAELEALYADLERDLAALSPRCELSGRCCKFREYGHRLYATRLEVEYLESRHGARPPADGACPYLTDGRCGAREGRMLGCRVFFCDPGYRDAMGPLYEVYHARVKEIHARHGIEYEYGQPFG